VVNRDRDFLEPPWPAPLDGAAVLRLVPESATVAGLFLEPLADSARRVGKPLPSARDRYIPFRFYPLREHVSLLLETCARLYPNLTLRHALRKLGHGAPKALIASTLGKVVLASAVGPHALLTALVKAYPLNMRPCELAVLELGPGRAVIRLDQVLYFLDCHHVGVFEGLLGYAGRRGVVKIMHRSQTSADFLLTWTE
jgi:uncharacterized protein (TIGR02265 family)